MRMKTAVLFVCALSAAFLAIAGENLVKKCYFYPILKDKNPKVFWWPRAADMSFKDGVLELRSGDKKRIYCGFRINISNEILSNIDVSLDAKTEGEGEGLCIVSFTGKMGKWLKDQTIKIKSSDWKSFSAKLPVPSDANSIRVSFYIIKGKDSAIFARNVSIVPEQKTTPGISRIKIQNTACESVCIVKSKPGLEFYDEKAAKLIRKYIYNATGQALEFKCLSDAKKEAKPGAILVGQAALQAGAVDKASFDALKPGGYAVNINNGVVALAGKTPSGVMSGAYSLLEYVFNVVFLSQYASEPEIGNRDSLVFKKGSFSKSPAFEFRFIRDGDALEYTDFDYVGDARLIGGKSATGCHTAPGLVDYEKYHKEHPEYFALEKDGQRLHKDPKSTRFDVHFCMSNKDVQKLIANQMLAWMDACPEGRYFWLTPGDGRGKYCLCENCKAMDEKPGNFTDRNLKFVNSIANIVAKKYPDKYIFTFAYVDIEEPPVKTKPAPNVRVLYCPYPLNWSNHLQAFDKENNAEGMRTLNGWLKWCPENMGIFCYPSCCGETLNIWPAFYANYEKFKYYAKYHLKGIYFCGLRGRTGGYLGHNSFNEMSRFVLGNVLWNPDLDVEKEIDRFMKLYYGPAAKEMREFFNLIHQEVKDRNFVQHTEEVKRGFVTKELADKSYAIFAKAEEAAKGNPKYLDRVLKEKVYLLFSDLSDRCRTNGKLPEKELPEYANKLAEFARLGKKFNVGYFARKKTPQEWFWDTALLRIKKSRWYDDPLMESLKKNPLDTIGESVPRCQEKIKGGFSIPSIGIAGGQNLKSYSYKCPKRDDLKILRRPSSGYGYMMTYLYLDETPEKPAKLELEGQDSDKPGKALMKVKVNGKVVFDGKVDFPKMNWGGASIDIPAGLLKKGKNLIEIENSTSDIVTDEEKKAVDFIVGRKKNYYWGWFIISGLKVVEK